MRVTLFLLSSLIIYSSWASEPQERKFFDEYRKYSAEPTDERIWTQAISQQKERLYLVQKGDTLWDVSRVLFGDPEFWPKIWSLNQGMIYNPHEILPAMTLNFYEGSALAPPTLSMGTTTIPQAAAAAGGATINKDPDKIDTVGGKVVDTSGATLLGKPGASKMPYRDVPENFTNYPLLNKSRQVEIPPFVPPPPRPQAHYNLRYMIVSNRPASVASLIELGRDNVFASIGDLVDVQAKGQLTEERYTFVELVKSKNDYYIYKYVAEAKIKESIGNSKYVLEIINSQEPIPKEAILIAGEIPKIEMKPNEDPPDGRKYDLFEIPPLSQQEQATLQNIFFIRGGGELSPGMELTIESIENGRRPRIVGKGLIVQSSEKYSTLLVTESLSGIKQGDIAVSY
ncbi:MAG: hypothetical protein V4736_11225 [Bdellovibrionota bacterium]